MFYLESGERRPRDGFVNLEYLMDLDGFERTGSLNLMPVFVHCFAGLLLPGLAVLTASFVDDQWHIRAEIRRAGAPTVLMLPGEDERSDPVNFVVHDLVHRCLDPRFAERLGIFTDTALDLFAEVAGQAADEADFQAERRVAAMELVKEAALHVASSAEDGLVAAVIGELKSVESPEPDAGSAWNFHRQLADVGSDHPLYEAAMDLLADAIRRRLKALPALDRLGVVLANNDVDRDWRDAVRDREYGELDVIASDFMEWHGHETARRLARSVQGMAKRD